MDVMCSPYRPSMHFRVRDQYKIMSCQVVNELTSLSTLVRWWQQLKPIKISCRFLFASTPSIQSAPFPFFHSFPFLFLVNLLTTTTPYGGCILNQIENGRTDIKSLELEFFFFDCWEGISAIP